MSNHVRGKTIYVLGAGASVHSGAPLLRDFLLRSQELHWAPKPFYTHAHLGIRHNDSFERLFKWLGEANLGLEVLDSDNLEDVFSIIELGYEASVDGYADLRKAVSRVLFETLAVTINFRLDRNAGYFDPNYRTLLNHLIQSEEQRRKLVASERFQRDSLITFNYDLLLDLSMAASRMKINYGMGEPGVDSWNLFKLHGSMNWMFHPECQTPSDDRINVIPTAEVQKWFFPIDEENFHLNNVQLQANNFMCKVCSSGGTVDAAFVPPTWSKSPLRGNISRVWSSAIASMRDAEQIVVIGYSLPETDTFFKYMLTLGLGDARSLRRVLIVNTDENVLQKYKTVFNRKKIAVELIHSTFGKFVSTRDLIGRTSTYSNLSLKPAPSFRVIN